MLGRGLQDVEDLPQVKCPGVPFGLCVCEWANTWTCSIVNDDDSTCWSCCCKAMHPTSYEHAKEPDKDHPFPTPSTAAPVVMHPGLDEGFLADELVKASGMCASVLGYVGHNQYVVRFLSTGEMKAFLDVGMVKQPGCTDVFPTSTAAPGSVDVDALYTDEGYFGILIFCCCIALCCCLALLFAGYAKRKKDEESSDSELEELEAMKAVSVADGEAAPAEAETAEAETWTAALYSKTIGLIVPSKAEAEEEATEDAPMLEAPLQEQVDKQGEAPDETGTWTTTLYANTVGLITAKPQEETEALLEEPTADADTPKSRVCAVPNGRIC